MCGIVGLVSKKLGGFFLSDVNIFSQMLVADSVRGIDGTGVFGTYGSGSVAWLKVGSHPYALLASPKWNSFSQAMTRKMDIVVGHNRKATAGKASNDNSHPFIHEHIVLVHNGVVHNHKSMAETEVDSHAIAHSMVDKGYEETIAKLQGAFTLVWFDMKDRMLRMVRNEQRPLYIIETDTQLVFASEAEMLLWLGVRNSISSWKDPKLLPAGILLSIDQVTKDIKMKEIKLYKPEPYRHTFNNGWEYGDDYSAYASIPNDTSFEEEEVVVDSVAESIRKDMPQLSTTEADTIESFVNTYKDGKVVTFNAVSMIPWNSRSVAIAGYNLCGTLRDDASIEVRASFEGTNVFADVNALLDKKVLKGTIFGAIVNPVTLQKSLQVRYVHGLDVYTTFNGTKLTAEEWINLCDTKKCSRCNAKLKITNITATSVNIKNPDNIRVFCPECVSKHMSKLPQEQRDKILAINEQLAPLLQETEREWNMRGSNHGS